jgi:hypothetical protein
MSAAALAAGNVTAVVTNGNLEVRGDSAGNAISIVLGTEPDTLEIGGFDGTTTVNGGLEAIVVTGVTGDLRVSLRAGTIS